MRAAMLSALLAGSFAIAPASAGEMWPAVPSATIAAQAPGSLVARLDHLPIVVGGLRSTTATLKDAAEIDEMFVAAFTSMEVAEADRQAVYDFGNLFSDDAKSLAEGDADITVAVRALAMEPGNADRLNNAAIAAWLHGVTLAINDKSGDKDAWYIQHAAVVVLMEANRQFPGRRQILLNLAYLTTVVPGWQFSGAPFAEQALALDPSDVTARALLASIQSRRGDDPEGAAQAEATLQPMVDDPALATLGHALVGDAHLAAATIRRAEAPAVSARHAVLALAAYDLALATSSDPGLHAGRAKALEILGHLDSAADAQTKAVELEPSSLDALIELARLRQLTGDVDGLRLAAGAAVALILGGWDPTIVEARFVVAPDETAVPEDRGYLGWSVGSGIDHLPVTTLIPQVLDGGPGVVVVETVPSGTPGVDHALMAGFAPRSAWELALAGAILAGDSGAAETLDAQWSDSLPWSGYWGEWVDGATLVASGGTPSPGLSEGMVQQALVPVSEAFGRAGRFAALAELCRAAGDQECAGAATYRTDPAHAAAGETLLRAAYEQAIGTPRGAGPELRMLVAAASEAAGDLPTAESFLAMTAGSNDAGGWRVRAALRAGDMRLAAGDPGGALSWYELALATIEANGFAEIKEYHADTNRALEFRGLRQVARNNHGVALLRSLQPGPETAPACDSALVLERCEAALADIRAASASDPDNAVYRMNEGWATRLLGKTDAARAALEAAVRLDPTLYPAFNDLGILLAVDGDAGGARTAFTAAIAADPTYDLAQWNLGILAMREGPRGILEGQLRLAAAIRLVPSLRGAPLDFRADNRTYEFGFAAPLPPSTGVAFGRTYSVGAVVLAATASIAALGPLGSALFGHGVQTAIGGVQRGLDRLSRHRRWRARQRAFRRRLPSGLRGLLSWLGVASLLVVVTGWQAAQASPAIAGSAIVLAMLATLVALTAHEVGHLLAARAIGGRLIPAAWGPGAVVSLLFLPVHAATGPFFAERIRQTAGGRAGAWRFHLAGPLANAIVGVVAYVAFLVEPVPAFRLLAQVQLAAIAYTLLPIRPLDGWALQREQPRLLLAIGFGVIGVGSAFALGLI